MIDRIRIIKHEAVPDCGSFEVKFPDGRDSVYFYWEDNSGRRLRPEQVDSETALEKAKEFARVERNKLEGKNMTKPDFDFDPEETVQHPGLFGPMTLRKAIDRLPLGPLPPETILNREDGKKPAFFNAPQASALREYFKAIPA
jgi:hypothetical protein